MDSSLALQFDAVRKTFPGLGTRAVLDGLNLRVAPGESVAIIGESGIGKSTLLNLAAGLDRPDAGVVRVGGVDLSTLDDDGLARLRRARVGFVFQAFHVLPYLDVAQNVALPLRLLGRHDPARVAALLEAVGLGGRGASLPRELSGGELQRVAVARAIVHRPALLLADEPTGNLDPVTAATVTALLREALRESGAAGVLVTHSPQAAASADRVLRLTPAGLVPA